jgi:hypothetical protein
VWRAKNAKKIPDVGQLTRNRMIEIADNTHYVVTLFGLMSAPGDRAKSALSKCGRVFNTLRKHYSNHPKDSLLAAELATRKRMTPHDVLQSARFLSRSPAFLSIQSETENPRLQPNEQYVTLRGFDDLKT